MKEITLKYRIILGGIAAIFIPFFIAGIIAYNRISQSLEQISREKTTRISKDLADMIQLVLSQEIKLIKIVSLHEHILEAASTGNYALSDTTLSEIFKTIGADYEDLFVTDKYGIIRSEVADSRRKGIDISEREYFKNSKNGNPVVSIPVVSKATGEFIIVVASPILSRNGKFLGIAGAPLKIDFMIKNISSINVGNTGYAFVTDADGLILIHPDKSHILTTNMFKQSGTEMISKQMLNNETGSGEYIYNGKEKIAGFSRVELTGWKIVVTQNREEIIAPAESLLFFMLFVGILFLAVASSGIVILSRKISAPIEKTLNTLKEISALSAEVVITIDKDRKILWMNQAAEKITGIPAEMMKGSEPVFDNSGRVPADEIWEQLESGKNWYGRVIIKGVKNEDATLEALLLPLKDSSGKIYSYLYIGRDITHELLIENRMQQAQKIEAIGILAGGIAHDFNNILSGIFGYAQLSLINIEDKSRTKKNIEEILKAAERARELVQQILTFSRKTDVDLRPVNLASIIREALILMRASIPSTIEIHESINSNAYIMGDRIHVHQVIVNLCTNAFHAIGSSSGVIKITLDEIRVDKGFARLHPGLTEGQHVQISVSDSGKGIESDVIDKIFDPFFTTKPHGEGTGLGLSVVHGIIQELKGIINVYSEPGKGTVFNVVLPVIADDVCSIESENNEEPINGGTERIFFIDDETTIINSFKPALESMGYSVKSFSEPLQALYDFRLNPYLYDIIITDYTMPIMTGIEITNEIRKLREDIPVILCSGYVDRNIEEISRNAGIAKIIKKPSTLYDMANAVRGVLDEK